MRPQEITLAFALIVINALGGVLFTLFLPDVEDRGTFIAIGSVFAVVMVATGYLLFIGNKWGSIVALIVQGLNILLAVPGFFDPDPKSIVIGVIVTIVLSAATFWFALQPAARAYWNKRGGLATA